MSDYSQVGREHLKDEALVVTNIGIAEGKLAAELNHVGRRVRVGSP